ncbi:hypothetical protein [Peterkaempfera bronchialis]|uniref:hypothetical protein n=1 Tax=Peterkaempfera bronchialis TaxID=2126346 RepID=UPI001E54C43E|nr:hypothetical protein [Peterkaempfera bronchialis]
MEDVTTEVVCYALTALGLAVGLLSAVRRRFLAATRWVAVALLPAGVYLAGLVPVLRRIGRMLRTWGADLVLSPQVWTGLGLLALALLLFAAAHLAGRRRAARTAVAPPSAPRATAAPAAGPPALRARPAAPQATEPAPKSAPGRKGGGDDLGDFSEIEEILRRRGI